MSGKLPSEADEDLDARLSDQLPGLPIQLMNNVHLGKRKLFFASFPLNRTTGEEAHCLSHFVSGHKDHYAWWKQIGLRVQVGRSQLTNCRFDV